MGLFEKSFKNLWGIMRDEWYIAIVLVMLFALAGELYDSFAVETRAERVHALLIERGYHGN